MTYGNAPLEKIDLRSLELFEACPAARGSGSVSPSNALDRWKVVREATVQWHQLGMPMDAASVEEIEESFFSGWDPVQRRLLQDLFAAYRRLFPPDVISVDLDPPFGVAIHEDTNRSINVAVQVDVETADGWQALRLKTGRSGTSPREAAAFYQPGEERTLVDIRLASDDLVTIPRPGNTVSIVDDLALRWDRAVAAPRTGRVAGGHCYSCSRPARCGQYPVVGEGRVTSQTRTLLISKTRLAAFARCVRSAAWPSVYGLPRDDGDEDVLDSAGLVVGNQFHRTVAAALLSDDPGALYEAAYGTVAPSETDDLRWLFDQHEAVWMADEPPVSVRKTEYQFGVTFVVEGAVLDRRGNVGEGDVAVTFAAATDVNGWEGDRTAAVVEHRTGNASSALPHEADLYALSGWQALVAIERPVDGVAVHFHHLRADPASCDRRLYTPDRIEEAIANLRSVATVMAGLHPSDALSPGFEVGGWCDWCQWADRCRGFRT
jgi:hypothetical protein